MTTTHGFGRSEAGIATLGGRPIPYLLEEAGVTTPAYFYDLSAIRDRIQRLEAAFGSAAHVVAYAVKANSAGSIVRTLLGAGAGIDAVSGGELELCQRLGAPARKTVLSGVAKLDREIDQAIGADILAIQAESVEELQRIDARAKALGRKARVAVRVNPAVEIDSHAHVSTGHDKAKFGILARDLGAAFEVLRGAPAVTLVGVSTHVGSMLKATAPYLESARVVCDVASEALAKGHALEYVNFGGGYGIDYGPGPLPDPSEYVAQALGYLQKRDLGRLMLVIEPGRSMVGPFGILVATVVQSKQSGTEPGDERRWLMVDAGMNDLMRPALYQAVHRIEPVHALPGGTPQRVVGPVCESTDDFGEFPLNGQPELVVIRDAGAYGFTMASEYNGRALPAEVFVDEGRVVHVSPSPGVESWINRRLGA